MKTSKIISCSVFELLEIIYENDEPTRDECFVVYNKLKTFLYNNDVTKTAINNKGFIAGGLAKIIFFPFEALSKNYNIDYIENTKDLKDLLGTRLYNYFSMFKGDIDFFFPSTTLSQQCINDLHIKGYKEIINDQLTTSISTVNLIKSKLEKSDLTSRQILILENVLRGACNKEIANIVNITEQGIKYHISGFLKKFQVKNRKELRLKVYDLLEKIL